MKTEQFRSILAIIAVSVSITTNLSPAQAFTLDDLLNTVRKGLEKGLIDAAVDASTDINSSKANVLNNNSEPTQGGGDIDDIPF
jgi:hypothetical protein